MQRPFSLPQLSHFITQVTVGSAGVFVSVLHKYKSYENKTCKKDSTAKDVSFEVSKQRS